jgi:CubicO group peptidase (beta-lactamase class C family)
MAMPARIETPGVVTAYSNYGTALAGYLVEVVSGEPFEFFQIAPAAALSATATDMAQFMRAAPGWAARQCPHPSR